MLSAYNAVDAIIKIGIITIFISLLEQFDMLFITFPLFAFYT
ncbi:hypothetical protein PPRY_a0820 [Pseudoalteromonas prydzensis ACAM 620]|nr:hypothetical protein [Pseudoalteromonas prydzensis ACAM 620]